jgi:predicted ATPase
LIDYLRGQRLLLVLDNFEHLLDGAALVTDILHNAPEVTVLITSRETLNLSGETVVFLGGLELPETDEVSDLLSYSAVRLLMQSAWQSRPAFDPADDRLRYAARICRLVEGVPLGVLLAAGWIEMLSLREIAEELGHGPDFLASDRRDMPDRHRSLRAVFESSWQRLSDTERRALMRLSVFRGSFTRQAALHISGASLHTLKRLVNTSLLRRDPSTGRYDVHELVRQFAGNHLVLSGEADAVHGLHSQYYAEFLHQRAGDIRGNRQRAALDEVDADFDNIRAAWQWAIDHERAPLIALGMEALQLFCHMRGHWAEEHELMQTAADHFAASAPHLSARLQARVVQAAERLDTADQESVPQLEHLRSLAQQDNDPFEAAFCLMVIGFLQLDTHLLQEVLTQFQTLDDPYYSATILHRLGFLYANQGKIEASDRCLRQSYALARDFGNHFVMAKVILLLGSIQLWVEGNYAEAVRLFSESHRIGAEMHNPNGIAATEAILGRISFLLGDFEDARVRTDTAWEIAKAGNDPEAKTFALATRSLLASMDGRFHDALEDGKAAFAACPEHPVTHILGNLALAVANCELANVEIARAQLQTGLRRATRSAFTAAQTWFLPVAAFLYRDHAVEWLALALHHPKSAVGWVQRWSLVDRLPYVNRECKIIRRVLRGAPNEEIEPCAAASERLAG